MRVHGQDFAVGARRPADIIRQRLGEQAFAVVGDDDGIQAPDDAVQVVPGTPSCSGGSGALRSRSTRTTCWLRAMILVFTVVEKAASR